MTPAVQSKQSADDPVLWRTKCWQPLRLLYDTWRKADARTSAHPPTRTLRNWGYSHARISQDDLCARSVLHGNYQEAFEIFEAGSQKLDQPPA